jgi:large subunit ribosomal protein L19
MTSVIDSIEQRAIRNHPRFDAGDRVKVHFQVTEGTRSRTQVFEGIVIKRQGSGARETFTVRKHSFGVGVERTFPLHSPKIEKLEVAARGAVRRAKLYYLRDKVGKQARVAERRWGIAGDLVIADEAAEAVDAEGVGVSEADAELVEPEPKEGEESEEAAAEAPAEEAAEPAAEEQAPEEAPADEEQVSGEEPSTAADAEGEPEEAKD